MFIDGRRLHDPEHFFFGSAEAVDQLAVLIDEETRRHMLIKQLIIDCQQMCVGQRRAGLPQER